MNPYCRLWVVVVLNSSAINCASYTSIHRASNNSKEVIRRDETLDKLKPTMTMVMDGRGPLAGDSRLLRPALAASFHGVLNIQPGDLGRSMDSAPLSHPHGMETSEAKLGIRGRFRRLPKIISVKATAAG